MEFLFFGLILLGIPFVLPILAWLSARSARQHFEVLQGQLETLTRVVESQEKEIDGLRASVARLGGQPPAAPPAAASDRAPVPTPAARPTPAVPPPVGTPAPAATAPPVAAPPVAAPPTVVVPPPPVPPPVARPAAARIASPAATQPPSPPRPRPPAPAEPPPPPRAFDWEGLVGVKAFSAIAGVALVIAAVSFLRYSIEAGWLQPPVRVAIGVVVALALLIVCELKAARRYPVTANAMDAAAIAVLFATFFAAHALWNLIPGVAAFALLAVVTALAVLLSVRRESLFIAVLGLLGGFATPALLSTGENRPIPLFAYLLLLNIGLAQVAHRKRWPILTALTLVFTTIYQWGWVMKFLSTSSLPLAMSVFLLFPLAAFASLLVRRSRPLGDRRHRENVRMDGGDLGGDAAALRVLPRGGAGIRRASRPAVWISVSCCRRTAGAGHRARARDPSCRQRRDDAARDGDVDGELVQAVHGSAASCRHRRRLLDVLSPGAARGGVVLASFYRHREGGCLRRSAAARGLRRSGGHRAAVRGPVAAYGRAAPPGGVDRVARDQL